MTRAEAHGVADAGGPGRLIDLALPAYDHVERHDLEVAASPGAAYACMRSLPARRVRLLRPLLALRRQPARLSGGALPEVDWSRPLIDELLRRGFSLLGERPGQELAIGAVGTFWKLGPPRLVPRLTLEEFNRFDRKGFNKVVLDFRCEAQASGARLSTETRIRSTDPGSARAFSRYWWFVSRGSAAIRASWLRAIARAAHDDLDLKGKVDYKT